MNPFSTVNSLDSAIAFSKCWIQICSELLKLTSSYILECDGSLLYCGKKVKEWCSSVGDVVYVILLIWTVNISCLLVMFILLVSSTANKAVFGLNLYICFQYFYPHIQCLWTVNNTIFVKLCFYLPLLNFVILFFCLPNINFSNSSI